MKPRYGMVKKVKKRNSACLTAGFVFVTTVSVLWLLSVSRFLWHDDDANSGISLASESRISTTLDILPQTIAAAPYITDSICRGCRHSIADPSKDETSERCGYWISQEVQESDASVQAAAETVANRYPVGCRSCSRNSPEAVVCDRRYWRYDAAAPEIVKSHVAETFVSVPARHRLSHDATRNVTAYFSRNGTGYPAVEYFMEYNPSIVILPENAKAALGLQAAHGSYYVASFRVSNQHYCFHPNDRKRMAGGTATGKSTQVSKDYLGLAVLDGSNGTFQTLLSAVLDLKLLGFPAAQDFRLFVLQNQLYISSYDLIAPIAISRSEVRQRGSSAELFAGTMNVQIMQRPACAPCKKKRGFCGKNFNYFEDSNGDILLEIWPTGPHTVRRIELGKECNRELEAEESFVSSGNPVSSFATAEEVDFPVLDKYESVFTRGRGGACCVPLIRAGNNNNQTLLIGLQHSKTPSQHNRRLPGNLTANHYVTSLYAFEPNPPYNLIAQSGWFCLGFPDGDSERKVSPMIQATRWRILELGRSYNCPRIQFVSGMTLAADDPGMVVVAYGINDCFARFVQVRLADLELLLFQDPSGKIHA